jgi:tetratricopeptide (TPR) repeat protein
MAKNYKISIFAFLLLLVVLQSYAVEEYKTFVAFSLKIAESKLSNMPRSDLRNKFPEIYNLGGITKPWMIVIDRENSDIILVGENDPSLPTLTLDDFVVSLKSAFFSNPDEYPGVTIDFIPCDVCRKNGNSNLCLHSTKQEVKFFAGIDNSAFGHTCFEADWLLKRINLGLEQVFVKSFKSRMDLLLESLQDSTCEFVSSKSRFWFIPKYNVVNIVGDIILIERIEMGVETELEILEINGKTISNHNSLTDINDVNAARNFSKCYSEISETKPVLKRLNSLCRLASLIKGLINVSGSYDFRYWLRQYKIQPVNIEKELDVIKVENRKYNFTLSGGVQMFSLINELKQGDSEALKNLVVKTRPTFETLFWEYEIMLKDNQLDGVFIPDSARLKIVELSPFFNHTNFLLKQGRFSEAIENYKMIIHSNSEISDTYSNLGIAYRNINQLDSAEYYYSQSIKIDSNIAGTYINIGALNLYQNKIAEAIINLERAIEINPYLTEAYNNIGAAYRKLGNFELAMKNYNKSIEIDTFNYHAYTNRGLLHYYQMDYNLSLLDLNNAIKINPYLSEAYNVLGLVYVDGKHDYEKAIENYTKAINIEPQTDYYINLAMAKANGLGKYKDAFSDINTAINLEGLGKAYAARATINSYLGNYQDAISDYKKAIDLNYNEFEVYNNLAFIYELEHKYKDAIETLKEYIQLLTGSNYQPNNKIVLDEINLKISRLNELINK